MLEHAEFAGNYYGTPKQYVEEILNNGNNIFLEIECQGALQVIEKMPKVISIFVLPPSIEELQRRLKKRGTESVADQEKRIAKAKNEMDLKDHYKYHVINDVADLAVSEILAIFKNENIGS